MQHAATTTANTDVLSKRRAAIHALLVGSSTLAVLAGVSTATRDNVFAATVASGVHLVVLHYFPVGEPNPILYEKRHRE